MELQRCQHQQLIGRNCKYCGAYRNDQISGLKSKRFSSEEGTDNQRALKALRKRAEKFNTSDAPISNNNLNEFLTGIVGKFRFSAETHALGLYIFYGMVTKRIKFSFNQLLYGSVSLLLAAKTVEKDPLVPRLSGLRKAACSYIALEEYSRAERVILQIMDYDLGVCTFTTFVNYYLSNGVLFSSELSESFDVSRLENLILHKVQQLTRSSRFLSYPPEKLAVYIIGYARQQLGLSAWNEHLEHIGQLTKPEALAIIKQLQSIQRPQLIPLHFHSINIVKVGELPAKKLGFRENSRDSMRDSHKNRLTILTNNTSARDARSVAVLRR